MHVVNSHEGTSYIPCSHSSFQGGNRQEKEKEECSEAAAAN
jgi:hypothetical protein